jgi:hypothetical protein
MGADPEMMSADLLCPLRFLGKVLFPVSTDIHRPAFYCSNYQFPTRPVCRALARNIGQGLLAGGNSAPGGWMA